MVQWPLADAVTAAIADLHAEIATLAARRRRQRPVADRVAPNSQGDAWTEGGFRSSFFKLVAELEATGAVGPGLTFHGLRHTVGTMLAELDYDDRSIADALGQETEAMARHYSRRANLGPKMGKMAASIQELETARIAAKRK